MECGAERERIRSCFAAGANGLAELVERVRPEDWVRPALGDWDVRGLVGHASRALSTVETYLGAAATGSLLDGPVDYFLAVLGGEAGPDERRRRDAAVAARGREAGAALGEAPASAVRELAERVLELVAAHADDELLGTAVGAMTLRAYLPTRTFELAVHSLDLARALGIRAPAALDPAVTASCELAGRLAGRRAAAPELLLLVTGRRDLPGDLSVL